MIHKLLNLARPLVVLDTETTGVDTQKDRVVELGFQIWGPDGKVSEWRSLVDPGILIPAATTKIHGITNADMLNCRLCGRSQADHAVAATCVEFKVIPRFAQVAEKLARGFSGCDFAGKNVRFDLRILAAEFARSKVEWGYADALVLDADRLEALLNPRHLSDLYRKYTGRELEGAHGALADVEGVLTVLVQQLFQRGEDGEQRLPLDLAQLHALSWKGWIDPDRKFYFDDEGVPRFTRWGKHADRPMADPEVSKPSPRDGTTYWDFILRGDFSADVKKVAAEAKLGRFPVMRRVDGAVQP